MFLVSLRKIGQIVLLFFSFVSCSFAQEEQTLFIDDIRERVQDLQRESDDPFTKSIPTDLVVLQAIIESGWGQSIYAQKANNLFGIYTPSKGLSYKSIKQKGTQLYIRHFKSLDHSIEGYIETLRDSRYYEFHKTLKLTRDPIVLLRSIVSVYSETKESEYIRLAKQIYRRYLV